MNVLPKKYVVDNIKNNFPVGCRVQLDCMNDPYRNIPVGTQGTVKFVDDIGTIHVAWACGSSLGIVYGEASCHRI